MVAEQQYVGSQVGAASFHHLRFLRAGEIARQEHAAPAHVDAEDQRAGVATRRGGPGGGP